MGVVDEAIQDGVSVGGLADDRMPVGHGELAGDQGGAPAVPIFEDLQQVVARLVIERAQPPVIQDQELDGAQRLEAAAGAAVAVGQGEFVEQLGDADVEDGVVVAGRAL